MNVELEFDGACLHNGRPGAIARYGYVVLYDGIETNSGCGLVPATLIQSNNVAEWVGALEGLKAVKNELAPWMTLTVRGDSQNVIGGMRKKVRPKADHHVPLWREIREILTELKRDGITIMLEWVKRDFNTRAHRAAKRVKYPHRPALISYTKDRSVPRSFAPLTHF